MTPEHELAHWNEQAAFALDYADARPASDMRGFFDAHRDRERFLKRAAEVAYGIAKHRARYAHKQSVVWKAADGWHVADYSRHAVRAAMLATGTQGKFSVVGDGATLRAGWRIGIRQLRSFAVAA